LKKKATFNLHTDVLAEIDAVAATGIAPSKSALVERAVIKELKELGQQARRASWQEAAKDPEFSGTLKPPRPTSNMLRREVQKAIKDHLNMD
jgi:hypothetical protein